MTLSDILTLYDKNLSCLYILSWNDAKIHNTLWTIFFFMFFRFFQWNHIIKCKNSDYTYLFHCINICRVPREIFLKTLVQTILGTRQMLVHENMYDPIISIQCPDFDMTCQHCTTKHDMSFIPRRHIIIFSSPAPIAVRVTIYILKMFSSDSKNATN